MSLFERLRGGSSTPTATAISANPATKRQAVAESSSFSSSRLPANDAENYDEREAAEFWSNLIDRIHWCDILLHTLCDLRADTPEHRADLLAVRKRMAPDKIDGDIRSLVEEIELLTPKPPPEPARDCRDCQHHRGRDNNRIRYCISADGAAQRNDALASPILDCSIATDCRAFHSILIPGVARPKSHNPKGNL